MLRRAAARAWRIVDAYVKKRVPTSGRSKTRGRSRELLRASGRARAVEAVDGQTRAPSRPSATGPSAPAARPCSGREEGHEITPGAAGAVDVRAPARRATARVGDEATRSPRSRAKPSRASTSTPVRTLADGARRQVRRIPPAHDAATAASDVDADEERLRVPLPIGVEPAGEHEDRRVPARSSRGRCP